MKRITLEELQKRTGKTGYGEQYEAILCLIREGRIRPVRASGINGKKPALYLEYWIVEQKETEQREALLKELQYEILPSISIDYYQKHPDSYEQDRQWVLLLNRYLKEHGDRLENPVSWNERSFDIWQREKFLKREQGKKLLKRCGLSVESLNVYETAEPFSYFTATRRTPQNILILENQDTFYSMRRVMLKQLQEEGADLVTGNRKAVQRPAHILGKEIGTLIYGAGKGIWRSFQEFEYSAEPYLKAEGNCFLYFGDLDYEGILIYEKLAADFQCRGEIVPFTEAYMTMLIKSRGLSLPKTREGQNKRLSGRFFTYFTEEQKTEMKEILEQGFYIPQEILNYADFEQ